MALYLGNGTAKARDADAPHTYAPTATSTAFKVLCQIVTSEDLHFKHFDVNQAFLQADIDSVVYVEQAEGFKFQVKRAG